MALYPWQTIAWLFFHQVIDQNSVPSKAFAKNTQHVDRVDMVSRTTLIAGTDAPSFGDLRKETCLIANVLLDCVV
jgi:hypothetical protein